MSRLLDTLRHPLNGWRRSFARHRQRRFQSQLLPRRQLAPLIKQNRLALARICNWIDDDVYEQSIFHYGLPREFRALIDLPQGNEPTYVDAMQCLALRLQQPVNYLELGVSVGKSFWQMMNAHLPLAGLTGFDIEDVSPRLREQMTASAMDEWQGPRESLRKVPSRCCRYHFPETGVSVRYLAADVFDEEAWKRLQGEKFNLIFSDAFHSPGALEHEFHMLTKYELIDPAECLLAWDDLHGDMCAAWEEISSVLKATYALREEDRFVLRLRGWLGVHEEHHPVGFVLHLQQSCDVAAGPRRRLAP